MESNSSNTPTDTADAQANAAGSSGSAWSDSREPSQPSQGSQPRGDGASMRGARKGADSFGRKATDTAQSYLQDARTTASATVQAGKEYAQDAVNAAGKKIDSVKDGATNLKQRGLQFAADEPMKAVAYAAAGSAVLTAVLLIWMRGRSQLL